jgi:hypothetical protein
MLLSKKNGIFVYRIRNVSSKIKKKLFGMIIIIIIIFILP